MKTIRAPPNVPLELRVNRLGTSSPSVVLIVSVLDDFSNLGGISDNEKPGVVKGRDNPRGTCICS